MEEYSKIDLDKICLDLTQELYILESNYKHQVIEENTAQSMDEGNVFRKSVQEYTNVSFKN